MAPTGSSSMLSSTHTHTQTHIQIEGGCVLLVNYLVTSSACAALVKNESPANHFSLFFFLNLILENKTFVCVMSRVGCRRAAVAAHNNAQSLDVWVDWSFSRSVPWASRPLLSCLAPLPATAAAEPIIKQNNRTKRCEPGATDPQFVAEVQVGDGGWESERGLQLA